MASKFYTGIDLCNQELSRARLQNLAAAPTIGVAAGMIFYDNSTTSNTKGRAILYSASSWKGLAFVNELDAYTPLSTYNELSGSVSGIDTRLQAVEKIFETDNDATINKWNEVVSFLAGIEGGTLEGILATYATKDSVKTITDWYDSVGKYFKYDAAKKAWYLDGDFYTTGENAAGNVGEAEGGAGGGIVDYDSVVGALGYVPARTEDLGAYLTKATADLTYASIGTVNTLQTRVSDIEAKYTRKYTASIAANGNASQTFTHSFNTRDVIVQIFEPDSPYEQVYADVKATSTSQVTITFAEKPTKAYRVVIIG